MAQPPAKKSTPQPKAILDKVVERLGPSLESQVEQLKALVDSLSAEVARLQQQCVRQSDQGELIFPRSQSVTVRINSLNVNATTGGIELRALQGITLRSTHSLTLDAPALSIGQRLDCDVMTCRKITASDGEFAKVKSGTVKCETVTAHNVVGSNYTPGAGNIW